MLEILQHKTGKISQQATDLGKSYIDEDNSQGAVSVVLPNRYDDHCECKPHPHTHGLDEDDVREIVQEELDKQGGGGSCECDEIRVITNLDIDNL